MMLANVQNALAEATPGQRGTCPGCNAPVLAKTGPIIAHHWAHISGSDCDPWSEPESSSAVKGMS